MILSDGENVEVDFTQATEVAISSVPAAVRTSSCVFRSRHAQVLVDDAYVGTKYPFVENPDRLRTFIVEVISSWRAVGKLMLTTPACAVARVVARRLRRLLGRATRHSPATAAPPAANTAPRVTQESAPTSPR